MSEERITKLEDAPLGTVDYHQPDRRMTYALMAAAVVVAVVSFFFLGAHFSSPQAYTKTIASLDAKKETVLSLAGASTGTSAAITFLPGDVATPIAEKLIDLSSDFMIVIAAIYLEKYLLTILGFTAFKVLVPLASLLFCIGLWQRRASVSRQVLMQLATKMLLFGLASVLVVPCSVFVSDMIERTYQESINETIAAAEQTQDQAAAVAEDEAAVQNQTSTEGEASAQGQAAPNILETLSQLPQTISQLPNTVSGTVTDMVDGAQKSLNSFIEALAVMIVTSCIIPILVLVFFLWLVRVILGINIELPTGGLMPRSITRRHGI